MMRSRDLVKGKKVKTHKYYKCVRCGYVSIIKSLCPICVKDGYEIKLK